MILLVVGKGILAKQRLGLETEVGGDEVVGSDDDMGVASISSRGCGSRSNLEGCALGHEYYIVSFSSKEDHDYAYYEGPWMIDDHYLLVQRWRPNFNPRKADGQRKVAVWVRIPDLPLEFCIVESLGLIDNIIGTMIKIDRSISIYDKGEFARICVEVDLHKPLLPTFLVFGEEKQLVYEGLHLVVGKSTSGILGTSNKVVGDLGQKKSNGLLLDQKEEGRWAQGFGKENKQRPKPISKVLSKLEAHKLEMKNSFISLREHHVLGTMRNHESKDGLDGTLSSCLRGPEDICGGKY
ncbi:hypothetical protein K1719_011080 [Acacia pycnantha]|nr:hypothetical protein K1719_011080 [Acacia pycnantha]